MVGGGVGGEGVEFTINFRGTWSRHAVHDTASWTRSEGLWKGPVFPVTAG